MSDTLVFVYGTLMQGERYHHVLAGSVYGGSARTRAAFKLMDLGPYPAMVAGDEAVSGELYQVDAATMKALDQLEGHPNYYLRSVIVLEDGREATAYLFVDADEQRSASPIVGGDWRSRAK